MVLASKWSTNAELNGFPYDDQIAGTRQGSEDTDGTKKGGSIELESSNKSLDSRKRTKEQLADFEGSQKMEQLKLFDKVLSALLFNHFLAFFD